MTGTTSSPDFPTTAGAFQRAGGGGSDAFVAKLDAGGAALAYSSYLGGTGTDGGHGIAVGSSGDILVAGTTASGDFPTLPGAVQPGHGGGFDAFVAVLTAYASPVTTRFEQTAAGYGGYWSSYGAETGTFSGGTLVASDQRAASATFSFTGTGVSWIGVRCNVCGLATVQIDDGAPATVDTFGPDAPGSLRSQVLFSASDLAADVGHTLTITVLGARRAASRRYVAVDAFDVTR